MMKRMSTLNDYKFFYPIGFIIWMISVFLYIIRKELGLIGMIISLIILIMDLLLNQ